MATLIQKIWKQSITIKPCFPNKLLRTHRGIWHTDKTTYFVTFFPHGPKMKLFVLSYMKYYFCDPGHAIFMLQILASSIINSIPPFTKL